MIGIVVVSHSSRLAEGVVELAREMGGAEVAVEAAGGLGLPPASEALGGQRREVAERTAPSEAPGGQRREVAERTGGATLGTSATEVLAAIERAWSDDGVLVLMDLGSAVLSSETALDLLGPERRERVLLCAAPLVEGAVAAAAGARAGRTLPDVAAEAGGALAPKAAQLGAVEPTGPPAADPGGAAETVTIRVQNPLGLHARPIARLIATAAPFRAEVEVTNLTLGRGPASARSLSALATLGVARGHEVLIAARGRQAAEALDALQRLAGEGFGEAPAPVRPDLSPVPEAPGGGTVPETPGPFCLNGLPASPGVARGQARHLRPSPADSLRAVPDDPEREWQRVLGALAGARAELESARDALSSRGAGDEAGILDAQILLLEDPALVEPTRHRVMSGGEDGARAWGETVEEAAAGWRGVADGYLRARAADLAGLARRVREHLAGNGALPPAVRVSAPGILIAADLSPGDAASLDPSQVFGLATATGGPTSHAAIVARALGIPAVAGLGDPVLGVPEGTELLLDGEAGLLYGDPSRELSAAYRFRAAALEDSARKARSRAREPAVTRDGLRVEVLANVGRLGEVGGALEAGADGVGLVRTELLFPGGALPSEEEQEAAYRSIADGSEDRPVVLRTFDLGGDKPPGGRGAGMGPPAPGEANPFLGLRGIRYALAHPELLRTQLAAVLRAAAGRPVKVMVPMVSTVEEIRSVKDLLEAERERLAGLGVAVADPLELGAMVEVPAAALAARQLAHEADFLSIGTNDLAQYAMAADRGNPAVARLADYLHPAVLALVRGVVEAGAESGRPVGLCGEAGSDPAALLLLVGLGLRQVSVAPGAIPAVKESIRNLDASEAEALAGEARGLGSAEQVRRLVAEHLVAGRSS